MKKKLNKKNPIIFPRRNQSIKNYIKDYLKLYSKVTDNIDQNKVEKIKKMIVTAIKKNNQIFSAGNGGSASISNHLMCDYLKGVKLHSKYKIKPKVYSLTNSNELITAISNDENFDRIFVSQIENLSKRSDLIIMFSCSGTSKNILNLIDYANKNKIRSILFSGFLKKKLNVNVNLNLNCKNYGLCEDIFSSLMHSIMQSIVFEKYKKSKLRL